MVQELAVTFGRMVKERRVEALNGWLKQARNGAISEIRVLKTVCEIVLLVCFVGFGGVVRILESPPFPPTLTRNSPSPGS